MADYFYSLEMACLIAQWPLMMLHDPAAIATVRALCGVSNEENR